jgi:tetratricopeptide (TPR) repeat protein
MAAGAKRGAAGARLASVALAAGLAIAAAEAAVRALGIAPDVKLIDVEQQGSVYKRSTNPVLGFELKASWSDPAADLVTSYPSTNSHGQRDRERTLERPAGVRRTLVLGASVVEGFGIRDLDDTICGRLEAMEGPGAEVLNFGVSAYCTRAKVELLKVKGLAFRPDEVVLFFTQNDFHNFNHEAFALGSPIDRPRIVEDLYLRSHLFRTLATRLDWFWFGAQVDPTGWNRKAIGDDNVVEGFRLLRELADEHGFRPVVALWPRFTDDDVVDPHPMPGSRELVAERLAAAAGLPSFRFSPGFRLHRQALGEPVNPRLRYTLGDHLHPNAEGCWVAAQILKQELDVLRAEDAPLPAPSADDAAAAAARRLGLDEPHPWRITVNLGNTLLQQGRYDEAIRQYDEALREKPDLAEAHVNRGIALKAKGDPAGAVAEYLKALEIDPALPDAHYNLGVALAAQGRPDRAAQALLRALELRPGFAPAEEALAALAGRDVPGGAAR